MVDVYKNDRIIPVRSSIDEIPDGRIFVWELLARFPDGEERMAVSRDLNPQDPAKHAELYNQTADAIISVVERVVRLRGNFLPKDIFELDPLPLLEILDDNLPKFGIACPIEIDTISGAKRFRIDEKSIIAQLNEKVPTERVNIKPLLKTKRGRRLEIIDDGNEKHPTLGAVLSELRALYMEDERGKNPLSAAISCLERAVKYETASDKDYPRTSEIMKAIEMLGRDVFERDCVGSVGPEMAVKYLRESVGFLNLHITTNTGDKKYNERLKTCLYAITRILGRGIDSETRGMGGIS